MAFHLCSYRLNSYHWQEIHQSTVEKLKVFIFLSKLWTLPLTRKWSSFGLISPKLFPLEGLKSKEQLTFTKCDSSDRTLKPLNNPSPCNITSQTTTLVAVLPETWQGNSILQGWNQAGKHTLYRLTTMTWKIYALD